MIINKRDWEKLRDFHANKKCQQGDCICIVQIKQLKLWKEEIEENKATKSVKKQKKSKKQKRDCGELSGKNCKSKWQSLCAAYAPDCNLSFGLKSGWNRGQKEGSGSGTGAGPGLHASIRYFQQLSF